MVTRNTIKTWLANKWNEIVESAKSAWGWKLKNGLSSQPICEELVAKLHGITQGVAGTSWNDTKNTARTVWNWSHTNIADPIKRAWIG